MEEKPLKVRKGPGGQPTKYTTELGERICTLIATNSTGLTTLLDHPDLPDKATVFNWLRDHKEFFDKYMLAKQQQAHVLADNIIQISESVPGFVDREGVDRIDNGQINLARLRIDALRWTAARLAPKHYGDRVPEVSSQVLDEELLKRKQDLDERNKKEY